MKRKRKTETAHAHCVCAYLYVVVCVNTSTILCKEGFQFPLSGSALSVSHFAPQIINSIWPSVPGHGLSTRYHIDCNNTALFRGHRKYGIGGRAGGWGGRRGRSNSYTSSIHPSNNKRPATAPTSGQEAEERSEAIHLVSHQSVRGSFCIASWGHTEQKCAMVLHLSLLLPSNIYTESPFKERFQS